MDEIFREAPIKSGMFDYIEFTRILKHGTKDKDEVWTATDSSHSTPCSLTLDIATLEKYPFFILHIDATWVLPNQMIMMAKFQVPALAGNDGFHF